uniref:Uncharacterized protein n=1 Tax=Anguilla anguilla TaxID=7936 RepID=A0A0E9XUU5_ANGAN
MIILSLKWSFCQLGNRNQRMTTVT